MKKTVLITGGLGFIGSNIAVEAAIRGYKVRILDAKLPPYGFNENSIKEVRSQVDLVIGDVRDMAIVKKCLQDVDVVIDLAAQVSHSLSVKEPFLDIDINCRGALTVLEAVRQVSTAEKRHIRAIYGSTRGVLGGVPPGVVVDETYPCNPADMNGIDKLAAEKYYMLYNKVYGIPTCALRINNTYGPRGQMRNDDYGVVNWFVRRAMLNESIVMHGDGSQTRDYNYVNDVVDAFLLAAEKSEAVGQVFWLGSGQKQGTSLRTVVEKIVQHAGSKQSIEFISRPKERAAIEIGHLCVSIDKIKKLLNWQPKVDLDEGLKRTISFYRDRMGDYVP